MDHYIRYANLASTLDPPMTDIDLLSAFTSHFEPRVQQGLICGNFQNTQDTLAFLAKYQGFGENRETFRSPRRDFDRGDVSRRTRDNSHRDERQRDRGNNVNMRYIRRQTDQRSGRYNSGHQINQDGRNFNTLNAELNPICHLLVLLGAHPILHVSRIRVNGIKNMFDELLNTQLYSNQRSNLGCFSYFRRQTHLLPSKNFKTFRI
jgi:hypothetical protein